ncbi:helix-turn-helix transcriptional regulator [Paenibacillus sp. GSMTC-2017]|uniref:helix-turn-helix domain-containing protein n=1 Tax=Paenibacillus sp. GSMTC-2017 TaxID=2794350 RepID=UPI0018D67D14|nr:helix-turn-helix transcriptional regulator [Paenibacillus sp. GSMTC-2017]MBH5316507.1 helix-turn-helix transcriptional regulator [Paenibacillus sp. GSMTC-2017]
MKLSDAIKKVRLELCLSQEGLARELHVGFTSVNRWENNHTRPNQIARHALIELCKNKNISPELIELLIKTK